MKPSMRTTVLITPDYTILPTGEGAYTVAPSPTDSNWSAGGEALARRLAKLFTGEGVALVDARAARILQLDPAEHWQTFDVEGVRVYLGQLDGLAGDGCGLVIPRSFPDTVCAFDLFHELTGVAYHRSPGTAGLNLLQALNPRKPGRKPVVWASDGPGDAAYESMYFPTDWRHDQPGAFLHGYDKRRSGLAALNVAEVARFGLKHKPRQSQYDPSQAGWWLVEVPAWVDPRMPDPAGYAYDTMPDGSRRMVRWLTNPTIDLLNTLAEQGKSAGVRIVKEAWLAPKSRLFYSWAVKVEQAYLAAAALIDQRDGDEPSIRAMDGHRVAEVLKDVYRETAGMFTAPTSWVKRHDWYATKIAVERANAWRLAWTIGQATGRWPSRVDGDKWWYADDREDGAQAAPAGLTLGTALGTWRHDGTKENI